MSIFKILDDTDPQIRYDPNDAWELVTDFGMGQSHNGTAHGAMQANAKASIQFKGSSDRSVSVTCLTGNPSAIFTATLDGNLVGTYNTFLSSIVVVVVPKIVFTINNLDDASHMYTLVLEKVPDDDVTSHLYIDSITIGGTSDSSSSSGSLSQSPSSFPATPLPQVPSSLTPDSTSHEPPSLTPNSMSQSSTSIGSDSLSRVPALSTPIPPSQPSVASTSQPQSPPSSIALSAGVIAGIVIAILAAIAVIVAFIWYRRRITRVTRPSTVPSPFIEAGMYLDDKKPEQVTQSIEPLTTIPSSSAPGKQAMALVASSSSLERGAAEVVDTLTNDNTRIDARNNGVIGPLLNPTVSSTLPLSMPLQSSNTSGRLNMGVILQEYSMFMDRVRHLAALQQTGGIGMRNEDEGHSDYHEPPPGYV